MPSGWGYRGSRLKSGNRPAPPYILKISAPIIDDPDHPGEWQLSTQDGEINEWFTPSPMAIQAMGARLSMYWRAQRDSQCESGWRFLKRLRNVSW
jgi:hypothetical protein